MADLKKIYDDQGNLVVTVGSLLGPQDIPEQSIGSKFKDMFARFAIDNALPGPMGMVMNAKNAPTLLSQLKALNQLTKASGRELTNAAKAVNWFKVKYPKLAGLPRDIIEQEMPDLISPGAPEPLRQGGAFQFVPGSNTGKIVLNSKLGVNNSLETLGHEATHAMQLFRGRMPPLDTLIDPAKDFAGYLAQPHEVAARKGGYTALQSAFKWKQILEDLGLLGSK